MKKSLKERKAVYSVEAISELIPNLPVQEVKTERVDLDGDMVFVDSLRLLCFKKDGFTCTKCGLKGSFFAKEKHPNDAHYHLELYAMKDGKEVIMTKDHRIPRSKGGPNNLENLDCMCGPCNFKKGNDYNG